MSDLRECQLLTMHTTPLRDSEGDIRNPLRNHHCISLIHCIAIGCYLVGLVLTQCRLQLPGLPFENKYRELMGRFVRVLVLVERDYSEQKEDPPIARNLPPISGKIAWARQLYRRISGPVEVFQKNQELMALPETKKAVKKYNRLARVLVEYELIFVQMWSKEIDQAKASLSSTLLVRHPETKMLVVNFDRRMLELLRDIQVMRGMGIEVPALAQTVYSQKAFIMERYNSVNVSSSHVVIMEYHSIHIAIAS